MTFRLKRRPVFRLRPFAGPADGRLAARLETYERLVIFGEVMTRSVAVLCEPPGPYFTVTT